MMTDLTADLTPGPKPLTPEARQLFDEISGVPCPMADGRIWKLARAGLAGSAIELRDDLFDTLAAEEHATREDTICAVHWGLIHNYDVSTEEVWELIGDREGYRLDGVYRVEDQGPLKPIDAIIAAMVPTAEICEFRYTDWLRASLIANGLDPAAIPPDDIPGVILTLIGTGRALPPERMIASARHGADRARHGFTRRQAPSTPPHGPTAP